MARAISSWLPIEKLRHAVKVRHWERKMKLAAGH
jgi:hypothetical protein